MGTWQDAIDAVAELVVKRKHAVALTGAGISVDSGIPDFRSESGLWSRFDPMEYATIQAFRRNPRKVWAMLFELAATMRGAEPNAGHAALASLEEWGCLDAVVTQNIDSLHQRGGSRAVVEFHGGCAALTCVVCGARYDASERPAVAPDPPLCACGAVLKPDVILFGEAIPESAIRRGFDYAERCSVMLVVGTSALVSPASELPLVARGHGAVLVEVNLEPTPISKLCSHHLHGGSSEVLPALAEAVHSRLA